MMRTSLLLLVLAIAVDHAHAQCGPYKGHPVWPDTVGSAFVNLTECGASITGCQWDNGSTAQQVDGLSVGAHSVVLYDGVNPVDTLTFAIEQLHWDLGQSVLLSAGAVEVDIWAQVPYCGTQIFNFPHCPPVADSTVVYLMQDGIAIDSLTPVECSSASHWWNFLPFGHLYQTTVTDHSICGSHEEGPVVVAYSLGAGQFNVLVQNANGGNNGSIQVLSVGPDLFAVMPPPAPVTGLLGLFTWPDQVQAGAPQLGSSAGWSNLAPGDYQILFAPDSLCNLVDTIVTIDAATAIGDASAAASDHLLVWPQPLRDVLYWSGERKGEVRVIDMNGRVVRSGPDLGWSDVSDLPAGMYELDLGDRRARFAKW
ncbi:MAG: T9SS type A sorting domain-containing protein [Flavobacteriales bacterium]|nr:T9SS type A sorting domain-containing protein [Flavobacteriales bacterium]MCB9194363.1 T9SS type A sorting domain-containing protein [Flavobacteriales bacterium]